MRSLVYIIIAACSSVYLNAQDIHLSQIHASPVFLNPSMAGLFQGNARVITNVSSQWNAVTKGYKTMVVSADMKIFATSKNDFLSGGIKLFADRAGDLNYTTASAAILVSYLKSLDRHGRNMVSLGFQGSYVNTKVDFTKIHAFEDLPALKNIADDKKSFMDMAIGASWFYNPTRYNSYHIGFSAFHINDPEIHYLANKSTDQRRNIYRRYNFHAGAKIKVTRALTLKPSLLFMDQGPHREITVGSYFRYSTVRKAGLHRKPLYYIYLGGWIRTYAENDINGVDAAIVAIKLEYREMQIALSYDINISKYFVASQGRGGVEFSFIHLFSWESPKMKRGKVKCPAL